MSNNDFVFQATDSTTQNDSIDNSQVVNQSIDPVKQNSNTTYSHWNLGSFSQFLVALV